MCKTNRPKSRKGRRAHSTRQKQKWSAERYSLNVKGDQGHTGSQASNAPRNGKLTDEKSSEQRATRRKRDRREVERAVRDRTATGCAGSRAKHAQRNETGRWGKTGGGEMRSERTMLADNSKNSTKQPSRNSRTNLGHTLGRRREATARQSSIVHYGA